MRIYRFEHNRAVCAHGSYTSDGASPTGHGPAVTCLTTGTKPRFGFSGNAPSKIEFHERCAVTAEQFDAWRSADFTARIPRGWDLVAYDVDDRQGWRYDNNQVVFNPAYATYVGTVTVAEVRKAAKVLV